jgi:hypothetical protein
MKKSSRRTGLGVSRETIKQLTPTGMAGVRGGTEQFTDDCLSQLAQDSCPGLIEWKRSRRTVCEPAPGPVPPDEI